jgi:uncharacterized protein YndB with AHSA1/START domain
VEEIERRMALPAPPARVWEALADPEQLSAWFGADVVMDTRPGGRATFRWPDGRERGAVVESADRPRRISLRWLPFERDAAGTVVAVGTGWIEVTLEEDPGGTVLRVVERGRGPGPAVPSRPSKSSTIRELSNVGAGA